MRAKESTPFADGPGDGFASTVWSLILAAGNAKDGGAALEKLCQKHWRPIYVFCRRSGLSAPDAEDATQEFLVEFLERGWLKQADPNRGSFRTFLLTLLRNFLSNRRRVTQAARRGGQASLLSLSEADGERELASLAARTMDPAQAYEAAWWNDLIESAWDRLAAEQADAGKAAVFTALRPFVAQGPGGGDYQRLAEQLALPRGQVALLVHRLNRRFAELVRSEVAETLADRSDLEDELLFLRSASSHQVP
jgi:RNA polymerase sigma-70 factor (ECF subfamily)